MTGMVLHSCQVTQTNCSKNTATMQPHVSVSLPCTIFPHPKESSLCIVSAPISTVADIGTISHSRFQVRSEVLVHRNTPRTSAAVRTFRRMIFKHGPETSVDACFAARPSPCFFRNVHHRGVPRHHRRPGSLDVPAPSLAVNPFSDDPASSEKVQNHSEKN